ncbi:UDP-N-acetylmuramate--L-alanine ligase [Nocardioides salsibiostraticola]
MRIPVPEHIPTATDLGRVHFVGIGGGALSGIARIMSARGIQVSGSDDQDTPFLPSLRERGITCHLGYDAAHLGDADSVVVTTAAREDNPEVLEARARGLRILPRSAGLKSVMDDQRVIAVAGTHGKTTTTSLLTTALLATSADPTYAIGGVLTATGLNADAGSGPLFVAEADESDGAFLVYEPFAAIVTNVDADHLDQWGTEEAYTAGFDEFVSRIDPSGFLVCIADDPGAGRLVRVAEERGLTVHSVGEDAASEVRAIDLAFAGETSSFTVVDNGVELGRITLKIPGRHYVLDALAALTVGLRLGHDFDELRAGLESFAGTRRRMEAKGAASGVRVYDSYAHHPVEIAGDLAAARAVAGSGRLVVIFQPHLVSRTRIFAVEMGRALAAADEVVVLDVYLAREDPDPEVTGALVAEAVPLPAERVHYVPDLTQAPSRAISVARSGDVVLTLGAGNVTEIAPQVLELLTIAEGRDG